MRGGRLTKGALGNPRESSFFRAPEKGSIGDKPLSTWPWGSTPERVKNGDIHGGRIGGNRNEDYGKALVMNAQGLPVKGKKGSGS